MNAAAGCDHGAVPFWTLALAATVLAVAAYGLFVATLVAAGRSADVRAVAGFVPDCVVLFHRLLRDDRVPRRAKLLVAGLIGYLAMPLDLVPDFIPVAGQLDDAIAAALVLRMIMRAGGPDVVREHWPGPRTSLNVLMRLAYRARPA
jgi:uncharacterized membrane protein YkvA (DUF1232 family)